MSGIRVAAFSKYFGIGALCSVVVCARHCAYSLSKSSQDIQQQCASISRFADHAKALEDFVEVSGLSIEKLTRESGDLLSTSAATRPRRRVEYLYP